jgi:hypothetical protein
VGDQDDRAVVGREVALELGPDVDPGAGVERGHRLVEQEQPRVAGQRAGEGDALRLAARELGGTSVGEVAQAEACEPPGRLGPRRRPPAPGDATGVRHVVPHGQVREEAVVLEDDADAALLDGDQDPGVGVVEDVLLALGRAGQRDPAGTQRQQPGQRRAAGSTCRRRWPEDGEHLAVLDASTARTA